MLNVKVIAVGKLKEKYLRDACEEYLKRLKRFCNLSLIEIDEHRLSDNPSEKEIEKALNAEAENILKNAVGYIIAMCIEGKQMSSTAFAEKLNELPIYGESNVTFIIGSSFGLSKNVKKNADFMLSMSDMTFPHHLARIMLLEQVYRAFNIISGGKYHK